MDLKRVMEADHEAAIRDHKRKQTIWNSGLCASFGENRKGENDREN